MPPFVGQISLVPFDFAPAGWYFCNGDLLPISEYDVLFQQLGFTFGGDGESAFALPNLKAPNGCHSAISAYGTSGTGFYNGVIGDTRISANPVNPQNLIECAGQALSVRENLNLREKMGSRFGGDDQHFNLPDLRAQAPANCTYRILIQGKEPGDPEDPFVGELVLLPYELNDQWSLQSFKLCNGDLLPVKGNMPMFSLLGNRFGGDGKQTFAVPDLRAVAPAKFNYYISLKGVLPARG